MRGEIASTSIKSRALPESSSTVIFPDKHYSLTMKQNQIPDIGLNDKSIELALLFTPMEKCQGFLQLVCFLLQQLVVKADRIICSLWISTLSREY